MTRLDLLQLVVARARVNGFELRRWYTTRLNLPWISAEAAVRLLEQQRRYYALIYSHEFASTFWKPGAEITFDVPASSFERIMRDGTTRVVHRKSFIRRSARPDAWRYHLREMAIAEEPLRYLRKYLHIEETLDPETAEPPGAAQTGQISPKTTRKPSASTPAETPLSSGRKGTPARPLPTGTPAFLARPYPPLPPPRD